jgi:hypothetical protein
MIMLVSDIILNYAAVDIASLSNLQVNKYNKPLLIRINFGGRCHPD